MAEEQGKGYGKRPLWQWALIYLVIGAAVYGIVYYFVFAKKGGNSYNNVNQQTNPTSQVPVAKNSVQISNFSFSPATLTVKVGDTVTWTNQDSMGHSATSDSGNFDTGILAQGSSGTVTFAKAGTFAYHCSIHPTMHGTIVVQ